MTPTTGIKAGILEGRSIKTYADSHPGRAPEGPPAATRSSLLASRSVVLERADGLRVVKYLIKPVTFNEPGTTSSLRFADALLMQAECAVPQGRDRRGADYRHQSEPTGALPCWRASTRRRFSMSGAGSFYWERLATGNDLIRFGVFTQAWNGSRHRGLTGHVPDPPART